MTALSVEGGVTALTLASSNHHKISEFQKIFSGFGIELQGLPEKLNLTVPEENGKSFSENADLKAKHYSLRLPGLVLSDDSGLCVDALDGQPGIHSARFAGADANDQSNVLKLLSLLPPTDPETRSAHFTCALSLASEGKILHRTEGRVSGLIVSAVRGLQGFGYDPAFFYPPLQKTFAEISSEEKCRLSHRFHASKAMAAWLKKR